MRIVVMMINQTMKKIPNQRRRCQLPRNNLRNDVVLELRLNTKKKKSERGLPKGAEKGNDGERHL